MNDDVPECIDCGICCFTTLPTAMRVTGDDHERMGEIAASATMFHGHRCFMRVDEASGHCASLRIDTETSRFTCAIYDVRPAVCRDLARGGPACEAERFEKSERPHVLLTALRATKRAR